MSSVERRLRDAGIELPSPLSPAGAYRPLVVVDSQVWISGQVAVRDGELVARGIVGGGVDTEQARACARQCAINVLAQLRAGLPSLDTVRQALRLTVFVAAEPTFAGHAAVADAASELIALAFGEGGTATRSAVGVASLPRNSPVEVDGVFALHPIGRAEPAALPEGSSFTSPQ